LVSILISNAQFLPKNMTSPKTERQTRLKIPHRRRRNRGDSSSGEGLGDDDFGVERAVHGFVDVHQPLDLQSRLPPKQFSLVHPLSLL